MSGPPLSTNLRLRGQGVTPRDLTPVAQPDRALPSLIDERRLMPENIRMNLIDVIDHVTISNH